MGRRNIRPSQFVTTYGVGSLLRIGPLHRVIPSFKSMISDLEKHDGFTRQDGGGRRGLDKFRIPDEKLEKTIGGLLDRREDRNISQIKIFKLPSNADIGIPDGERLYSTDVFPKWSICRRHKILRRLETSDGRRHVLNCSICMEENVKLDSGMGVRFIQACDRGHMDDIDWHSEVHRGGSCEGLEYDWSEEGNRFDVGCRTCGRRTSYYDLKRKSEENRLQCTGNWAELDSRDNMICGGRDGNGPSGTARIVLKNASNLRISHVLSSLVIPPFAGRLYRMLSGHGKFLIQFAAADFGKEDVIREFSGARSYLQNDGVNEEFFSVLNESSEQEIREAVAAVLKELKTKELTEKESEDGELEQLLHASSHGYPRPITGDQPEFMVDAAKVTTVRSDRLGMDFVVTPIDILHVVKAQVGYRREVKSEPEEERDRFMIKRTGKLVQTYYEERSGTRSTKWFVGKKIRGEGIFIHSPGFDVARTGAESWKTWQETSDRETDERLKNSTDPNFVWWHSLAHRLIIDLAIDSGFQSTAIAEKTYLRRKPDGTRDSGILLYAVDEGIDGTLGGLTGLAPNFAEVLERSASRLTHCSNDPICQQRAFDANRVNGSACHACMLISETSCGLQNRFLDRRLLLESTG